MAEKLQTTNIYKHNFNTAIQSVHNQLRRNTVRQEERRKQERGGTGREVETGKRWDRKRGKDRMGVGQEKEAEQTLPDPGIAVQGPS